MTQVVISDDHAVFLDALSTVLSREGWTVTKATTIEDTFAALSAQQPDVCLIDRHFAAGRDVLGALRDLSAVSPRTKVLILSADGDTESIMQAMRIGAAGYVHKTRSITVLKRTIERVLCGEVVVEVPAGSAIGHQLASQRDAIRLARSLTARERQCLELLVAGQDTAAMVSSLGVSAATVRTHVQALLTKLGAHSRLEAAAFAVRHRLLDDQPGRPDLAWTNPGLAKTVLGRLLPAVRYTRLLRRLGPVVQLDCGLCLDHACSPASSRLPIPSTSAITWVRCASGWPCRRPMTPSTA